MISFTKKEHFNDNKIKLIQFTYHNLYQVLCLTQLKDNHIVKISFKKL